MLFVVKSSQYAHSTEDTTQRVVNMLIAAMPTGAPTSESAAVAASIAAITAGHACCCHLPLPLPLPLFHSIIPVLQTFVIYCV